MTEYELRRLFRQLGSRDFQLREPTDGAFLTTNCPLAAIPGRHKHQYDETPALSVRLQAGHGCICFACGFRGSLLMLARLLDEYGQISPQLLAEVQRDATANCNTGRDYIPRVHFKRQQEIINAVDYTDRLMLTAHALDDDQLVWLQEKGCSAEVAKEWGLCGGSDGIVVFPVYGIIPGSEDTAVVGAWARRPIPLPNQRSKYFAVFKFEADKFVYGETRWATGLPMVIFEGMLDVLHAATVGLIKEGYNLAAVQRSNLSSVFHINKILHTQPPTIYILGDNDSPGWIGAAKTKRRLDYSHPDVRSTVAPKDPKTMTLDELLTLMHTAPKRGIQSVQHNLKHLRDFNRELYKE